MTYLLHSDGQDEVPTGCPVPYSPKPAGASAPIEPLEADLVLARFTRQQWQLVDRLPQVTGHVSRRNPGTARKLILNNDGRLLMLKQVPWYADCEPHARAMALVQRRAALLSRSVVGLLATTDGEPLAAIPAAAGRPRLFTLQEIFDGSTWDGSLAQCRASGRSLAQGSGKVRRRRLDLRVLGLISVGVAW